MNKLGIDLGTSTVKLALTGSGCTGGLVCARTMAGWHKPCWTVCGA